MKKIETSYAKKMVNPKFYSTVEVSKTDPSVDNENKGYIYVPYVFSQHTEESLKDYNEFMNSYHKNHAVCPNCGGTGGTTTLMGYVLHSDKRDEYKDMNSYKCSKCGDVHTVHDRISVEQFNLKIKN